MGKIKKVIEKIKNEENLTTQEVLTKYPDLAILLEQEEQQENERQENIKKGLSYSHNDIMDVQINNTLNDDEECLTGIDNILNSFSGSEEVMTYDEFYKQKLEALKLAFPGLRLSQYKDKIFQLWKKSSYNIK